VTDEFESLIAGIEAEHRRVVTAMEKDYADLASQLGQAIRERDDLRRQLSGAREAFEALRVKLYPLATLTVPPQPFPYQPITWTTFRTGTAATKCLADDYERPAPDDEWELDD
jgi:hypothetical protein